VGGPTGSDDEVFDAEEIRIGFQPSQLDEAFRVYAASIVESPGRKGDERER